MREAIRQAKKAGKLDEVPIGCVIVRDGKIIARGYNRRNTEKSTLAHAEIQAIRKASKVIGDWRLEDCTMYITLEPCQMCAGAIVQARIPKVVIGSRNPKAGCAGSILDLLHVPAFNHQVELEEGVLQEECSEMLTSFVRHKRRAKSFEKWAKKSYTEQASLKMQLNIVIRFPCSRGDGGALYLQSALVGVISCPGLLDRELPCISGIDVWVLRNRNL